jgi:hypothetical protein
LRVLLRLWLRLLVLRLLLLLGVRRLLWLWL